MSLKRWLPHCVECIFVTLQNVITILALRGSKTSGNVLSPWKVYFYLLAEIKNKLSWNPLFHFWVFLSLWLKVVWMNTNTTALWVSTWYSFYNSRLMCRMITLLLKMWKDWLKIALPSLLLPQHQIIPLKDN